MYDALHAYQQIAGVLNAQGMAIVHERIFGSQSVEADVMAARRAALQARHLPSHELVTYILKHQTLYRFSSLVFWSLDIV
jgi:hypothetical protein